MDRWVALVRAAGSVCALHVSGGPAAAATPAADTCNLELASHYVGAAADPAIRRMIAMLGNAEPVRWITPGQPIRPDFDPWRLNVILDETGRITAMRCG
jgi:hypothetical protein